MGWHKMTKKELIQAIEQLEKIARDNKEIADRAVKQAKEWQAMCTEDNTSNVSIREH